MHSNKCVYLSSLIMNLSAQILIISKSSWCGLTVSLLSHSQKVYSYRKFLAYMTYISQFKSKKNWQIQLSTLEESDQLSIMAMVFLLWKIIDAVRL